MPKIRLNFSREDLAALFATGTCALGQNDDTQVEFDLSEIRITRASVNTVVTLLNFTPPPALSLDTIIEVQLEVNGEDVLEKYIAEQQKENPDGEFARKVRVKEKVVDGWHTFTLWEFACVFGGDPMFTKNAFVKEGMFRFAAK